MKKIIITAFILSYSLVPAITYGYEEVRLITNERTTLSIPKSNFEITEEIEKENAYYTRREEKPLYFEEEEDVFDNKAGKIFSKFINEKAINNKLNRMYSEIESKYLDDNY